MKGFKLREKTLLLTPRDLRRIDDRPKKAISYQLKRHHRQESSKRRRVNAPDPLRANFCIGQSFL
jgi:hypothetical protein